MIALLGLALAIVLPATGVMRPLELVSVDARFAVRGAQPGHVRGLLLVAIDANSDEQLKGWPIHRRLYAQALKTLRRDGARLTAIDIQFDNPTDNRDDDALIYGLRADPGTVLVTTDTTRTGRSDVLGGVGTQRYAKIRIASGVLPIDTGGTYRRFNPVERGLRTLPVVVAHAVDPHFHRSQLGHTPVWIDYAGGPGTVPTVSFLSLLQDKVPASEVRGRIVVIGNTDPAVQDVHNYSTLDASRMAGTEIEANGIATALRGAPLRRSAGWLAELLTLICGLVAVLIVGRRIWVGAAILLGAVLTELVLGQLVFDAGRILPVALPVLELAITGAIALGVSFVLEIRQRAGEVRAARQRAVAAADEARRRVERDLHDGVQQRLIALAMGLSAPGAGERSDLLPDAVQQIRSALQELRQLSRGAYPAVLREAGLEGALQSLADHAALPVTLDSGGVGTISDDSARTAYFVAAEGIANAAKHAGADGLRIDLARKGDQLRMALADDGRGGADASGSGLAGLRERAEAAGGTLAVTSPPGQGTTLELRIPV